jgi:aquaglyceroporin related protein, other eukaryote
MASDQIQSLFLSQPAGSSINKESDAMALEKESLSSSTPPATHNEHGIFHAPQHYRDTTVDGVPAFAEHGPLVDHKVPQEDVVQSMPDLTWSRIRHYMREPFSEFMGVFILIMFGDGVVAQVVLSNGTKGDYQSISWGWG